jgi:hypothetical protein
MKSFGVWNKLLFLIFLIFASSGATAWVFGPKNFDECMAKEMKDQQRSYRIYAENLCRNNFPAVPEMIGKGKRGELICSSSQFRLKIIVSAESVVASFGTFKITERTNDSLDSLLVDRNEKSKALDPLKLRVRFGQGTAAFYHPKDGEGGSSFLYCEHIQ